MEYEISSSPELVCPQKNRVCSVRAYMPICYHTIRTCSYDMTCHIQQHTLLWLTVTAGAVVVAGIFVGSMFDHLTQQHVDWALDESPVHTQSSQKNKKKRGTQKTSARSLTHFRTHSPARHLLCIPPAAAVLLLQTSFLLCVCSSTSSS